MIEAYFEEIHNLLESLIIVKSFNINFQKRDIDEGFIRGNIYFVNDSILHVREFISVQTIRERKMYSYHYMDARNNLIFRYDDAEHHQELNLSTFPHHKHEGSEDNIISSNTPTLAEVLQEIEEILE
ncbi:MAG: hypothetical protein F6K54_00725 [Okeania sp. SIO3B5]|uniref:toxin-antitoxin system TumE family protein n=1 Tax=Okeania sp. SIO3B5 TaxID=2607811 RepID=UPI0013FE6B53|nr:DUF6516 family protein [Okeania sp. SIO3B5]NEO51740.1 hypothetical protein [Okeania sp. SIO3B5]